MLFNATQREREAREYYDKMLDGKLDRIAELSGVDRAKFEKINPADFIEPSEFQVIEGYHYQQIGAWLREHKRDDNYLISPMDDDQLTANQISYKEHIDTERIRASKCQLEPIPARLALQFFRRNHRQTLPRITSASISYGLIYHGQLVGVMTYDKTAGGIRGHGHADYELLRLAFAHGKQIMGGASRLEKACEATMANLGEKEIFSYSNATVNTGRVYAALGFEPTRIDNGQPFVIMEDFSLRRLIELHPHSTNKALARAHRLKTHLGGNITWTKDIK